MRHEPYVAPWGKFKYCAACATRQPFEERFTPLCPTCAIERRIAEMAVFEKFQKPEDGA